MSATGCALGIRVSGAVTACVLAMAPFEAVAKQCSGGLLYLGNTKDSSQSVWLSGVPVGAFRLEAAQGSQVVDIWAQDRRGLHLSLSPVVSQGNGGTHKLYEISAGNDCLIATQNQKRGFDPPGPHPFPPVPPGPPTPTPPAPLPPIHHFFPDFGGLAGLRPGARPAEPAACVDPRTAQQMLARGLRPRVCEAGERPARVADDVPLTPGRDLGARTMWNAWTQTSVVGFSDRRFGLDTSGYSANVSVGLDRQIGNDVIAGLIVSLQTTRSNGFNDFLQVDTNGFNVGPYIAARLSSNWAIDATVTFGYARTDMDIAVLGGDARPMTFAGSVNLHGQYRAGEVLVRPKLSAYFARVNSDEYDVSGTVMNVPIAVTLPESKLNYGMLEATTEFSRVFEIGAGRYVMPYVEIGGRYAFERPNDGAILTGDLTFATPTPWSGSVRSGFRMNLSPTALLEANAAYLSLGQNGLDIWEGRLRLSVGF